MEAALGVGYGGNSRLDLRAFLGRRSTQWVGQRIDEDR